MARLPKLPNPADAFSAIDKAGSVIDKGLGIIDKVSDRLDKIGLTEAPRAPTTEPQSHTASATPSVSDKDTLLYQLDHLVSVLKQTETHLSEGCRIMGVPCDCCAKHAMEARNYAMETISIAARMNRETSIYQDIADWASEIEKLETPEKVQSGDYDETFRKESGTASKFRKKVQSMIGELKGDEDCPGCEERRETITSFIERRKEGGQLSPKDKERIRGSNPGAKEPWQMTQAELDRAAVDLFIERHGREAYERGEIGETLERIDQKAEEYDPVFLSAHPELKGQSITVYHDPLRGEDLAVINTQTGEVIEVLSDELRGSNPGSIGPIVAATVTMQKLEEERRRKKARGW